MRENADQNHFEYGHFSRSVYSNIFIWNSLFFHKCNFCLQIYFFWKKSFHFSPKDFIIRYVAYFKITEIAYTVVTLFVMGFSAGIGVYKFIS